MPKVRTKYVCEQCGGERPSWLGKCPECGAWNSLSRRSATRARWRLSSPPLRRAASSRRGSPANAAERGLGGVAGAACLPASARWTGSWGGGIDPGPLCWWVGDPGIGKSTLLWRYPAVLAEREGNCLYVLGEESLQQIKCVASRLGLDTSRLYLLAETDVERKWVGAHAERLQPVLLIGGFHPERLLVRAGVRPGSVGQLRECTMRLMQQPRVIGIPTFLVGHVTKEGMIAGP